MNAWQFGLMFCMVFAWFAVIFWRLTDIAFHLSIIKSEIDLLFRFRFSGASLVMDEASMKL